jgi:diguanylate cyclase (GGDEF)-like protein
MYLQWSVSESTQQLKRDEIKKTQQYAANIASWIMRKTGEDIEKALREDTALRQELNEMLETFVIPKYAYIFLLKRTPKGHYRFLLDGSKKDKEEYGTLFFPQSKLFDQVYFDQKVHIVKQKDDVKGVWLSLLYPVTVKKGKTEALLVLDLSKWYGKSLESYHDPLQDMISVMQLFLLLSFIFLSVIFYRYYQFRKSILIDPLTQVYTKRYIDEFFQREKISMFHVIVIDIDEFKELNRNYGYDSGDSILKIFVQTLQKLLPSESIIVRTGGAEFTLFLPKRSLLDETLQKLFYEMRAKRYLVNNNVIEMTLSIVGMTIPKDTNNILSIIRLLDEEMLKVKSQGKNSYRLVDLQSDQEVRYRQIDFIKQSLEEERVVCLYQPIVRTDDRSVAKYEVLVRLYDAQVPDKLISPAQFLPAIKGTSYYIKMSKLVLQRTFETLERYPDIELSINLDLNDLYNMDMMRMIMSYLSEHRRHAKRVTFEILEENEIKDYETANFIFSQLRAYGSKVAIDDFGSGYSNYNYLIRLDIDILKIDGSLIRELHNNPERARVVLHSFKTLSDALGYQLVAEFVSDEIIYREVKALGFDYVQGYYLGAPHAIERYMQTQESN